MLRSDLNRTDVVKWVKFSRNLLALLLVAIVSNAVLSTVLSTGQARILLERSLAAEGEAMGRALARSAFVPLTLEDDEALRRLASAYQDADNLVYIRILDEKGLLRYEEKGKAGGQATHRIKFPVLPLLEPGEVTRREPKPVGQIEIGMSSREIQRQGRTIAFVNIGASALLGLLVLVLGSFFTGRLIQRMHNLIGEARLTEELRQANAELEAFSYSVSHDLRAPLRHIDGFSQALSEDYEGKLDDQAGDYLRRIRAGCQRMGRLIDDLLGLSRVVRKELNFQDLDLSQLVRTVADQIMATDPRRNVEFVLAGGIMVRGDSGLLQAAFENLLGNAWKFTLKTPAARIEFGMSVKDGKHIYFVRDNGAGFDMTYAGKLFSPFQRLHSEKDFPGTGIGLATVGRIVQRHGGRIWAEGSVGQGASFYFTLNPEGGSHGKQ